MANIVTKDLNFLQLAADTVLSQQMLAHPIGGRWEALITHTMQGLLLSIRGMVASEDLKVITIKYPRDWWEAVKERWAPTWALSRWPVRYREHKIDLKAVYPEMPLPATYGRSIRIMQHTDNRWEDPA